MRFSAQIAAESSGEGVCDSVPGIDIKAEFIVAAVKVLDEGVSCADHSNRAQPFETAHGP